MKLIFIIQLVNACLQNIFWVHRLLLPLIILYNVKHSDLQQRSVRGVMTSRGVFPRYSQPYAKPALIIFVWSWFSFRDRVKSKSSNQSRSSGVQNNIQTNYSQISSQYFSITFTIKLTYNPIVAQLAEPLKVGLIIHTLLYQRGQHIPGVNIKHHQCSKCDSVLFGQLATHQSHNVIYLSIVLLQIGLKSLIQK